MFNQNYRRFETKELSVNFKLQQTWSSISIQTRITALYCNKGQKNAG